MVLVEWKIRDYKDRVDEQKAYSKYDETLFSLKIHHGGFFTGPLDVMNLVRLEEIVDVESSALARKPFKKPDLKVNSESNEEAVNKDENVSESNKEAVNEDDIVSESDESDESDDSQDSDFIVDEDNLINEVDIDVEEGYDLDDFDIDIDCDSDVETTVVECCRKWELTRMPCKHVVAIINDMALTNADVGASSVRGSQASSVVGSKASSVGVSKRARGSQTRTSSASKISKA
ncbi:hypothetical protein Tco_1170764 [Tanacetum coccineum]